VRNPRRVTFVLNGFVDDARYGLRSNHAYWVSGLELADPGASPPMGTVDVTSGAIPARAQEALPTENAAGALFNGARAYRRQTLRWRPGEPEPLSDAFAMHTTNLRSAELDLRRMRLARSATVDGTVETDTELVLRLRGRFGKGATVTRDGRPQPGRGRRGKLVLTLPAGTSRVRITRPR
jgi:hypothetical protein